MFSYYYSLHTPACEGFLYIFFTHVKSKNPKILHMRPFFKTAFQKTRRVFIWGLRFTEMLLRSEYNELFWCLQQAVLPYFLSFLSSCLWCGIPQKLSVNNKKFQLTFNLARGVKFIYFSVDVVCEWSLTNKNELEFTLDDSNSKADLVAITVHKTILCQIAREFL